MFLLSNAGVSCSISKLCSSLVAQVWNRVRNFEVGTQFGNWQNTQRNFEIAQIAKKRGTYIYNLFVKFPCLIFGETTDSNRHSVFVHRIVFDFCNCMICENKYFHVEAIPTYGTSGCWYSIFGHCSNLARQAFGVICMLTLSANNNAVFDFPNNLWRVFEV